ncbi:MAG TPA: isoprenylcysteine carboxylmethyltransferase family protein [Burkholderiales bacterium]|nr:isoprenylcysteine carboxylmethyltransferase family protein [Burkholderiales bacterium]
MLRLEHRVPPPLVLAACALLMWLVAFPAFDFALPGREMIAAAFFTVALIIGLPAVLGFHRAKTTVNPLKPETSTALVTGGIYRWTRNPMYLAMLLLLVAWACLVSNWAALAILPLFVAYLNRFQIGPEERALQARFGAEFESYRRKVRRWL